MKTRRRAHEFLYFFLFPRLGMYTPVYGLDNFFCQAGLVVSEWSQEGEPHEELFSGLIGGHWPGLAVSSSQFHCYPVVV
jgi:hypothetical protein